MTVIFPGKFIYYQTPRTASNSLQNSLIALGTQNHVPVNQNFISLEKHDDFEKVPLEYKRLPGVTTIRNPFDIICSWWVGCGSVKTISEWILEYTHSDFIRNKKLLYHAPHCTFIIRFELNIVEQINRIMTAVDCKHIPGLSYVNKTKSKTKHYSHYYTSKDVSKISELFWDELEEFDYVFKDQK